MPPAGSGRAQMWTQTVLSSPDYAWPRVCWPPCGAAPLGPEPGWSRHAFPSPALSYLSCSSPEDKYQGQERCQGQSAIHWHPDCVYSGSVWGQRRRGCPGLLGLGLPGGVEVDGGRRVGWAVSSDEPTVSCGEWGLESCGTGSALLVLADGVLVGAGPVVGL